MKRARGLATTLWKHVYTNNKKKQPAVVLAVLLIALAFLVSGTAAQKNGDPETGQAKQTSRSAPLAAVKNAVESAQPVGTPRAISKSSATSIIGGISGTVTAAVDGAPLLGMEVTAYVYNDGNWDSVSYDETDANGDYEISGLYAGTYRVKFYDAVNHYYPIEFFNNVFSIDSADDVYVRAGSITTGIDGALDEPGHITGTVTAEAGGAPVGVRVKALIDEGAYWRAVSTDYTDANGDYELDRLGTAPYRVEFLDYGDYLYATEYYDDAPDLDSASDIFVTAGSTTAGIDAALATAGHITGKVTAEDSGAPLQGKRVNAYFHDGYSWKLQPDTSLTDGGDYDIGGLGTGTYRVKFSDSPNEVYATEYYDNAPDINSADDITVTAGSTTTDIDAALALRGHITGAVTTEASGVPLVSIFVSALSFDGAHWKEVRYDTTDANGDYDIDRLDTGIYRIRFYDNVGDYLTEYYDNVTDIESAADVPVILGSTTTGIDATLTESGHITGTVTAEAGGAPLALVYVNALTFDGSYWRYVGIYGTNTDAGGYYDLHGLGTDVYRVEFYDYHDVDYAIEYFDDAADAGSGSDVYVTAASTTAGIDAVLALSGHAPPANDDFDAARVIGIVPYQDTIDVHDATTAADDPLLPCGPTSGGYGSVWYAVTPQWRGSKLTADTSGSRYHNVLVVWQGSRGSLIPHACNSGVDWNTAQVTDVPLAGGSTYFIEVAGYGIDLRRLALHINLNSDPVTRDIPLAAGWNMVSSYVDPDNPALGELLADIESDLVLVKNGDGQVYWPAQMINDIADWDVRDGYQVYMANPALLSLMGPMANPVGMSIDLPAGWSLIAYLPDAPLPVGQAVAGITSQLVLVKNSVGEVYWPAYDVNQIGEMQPGEGYQMYMDSAATLVYHLPPPTVDFTADVVSGLLPLEVHFSDLSTGGPFQYWAWDFGDGYSSPGENPRHIYNAPGVYTVSLTVTNSTGFDTETKSGYITVQAPEQLDFTATADTHVRSINPDRNYGSTEDIRIKNSVSDFNGYLMFDVQGITRTVQQATLRLYVNDASPDGGTAHVVNDISWSEGGMTWNNAPAMGQALSSAGAVTIDQWVEIDVTSAVTGNGLISFGIASASSDTVIYSSREGANAPELVIIQ